MTNRMFAVNIAGVIYPLSELAPDGVDEIIRGTLANMSGIPTYWALTTRGLWFWPKPIKEIKVYELCERTEGTSP